jgi:hypothetical protein
MPNNNNNNNNNDKAKDAMKSIIAKVELWTKIAQIALKCPICCGSVNKEIEDFKISHQGGGRSSLPAMNDKDGLVNEINSHEYK